MWGQAYCGMGLLPDTQNCGLCMRRECRERFPRHRLQRKPLVSDPDMHHGTCATHVPWCMSGSLTRGGVENVPGIPGACATPNFTYLARGPWWLQMYWCQESAWPSPTVNNKQGCLLCSHAWQAVYMFADSGVWLLRMESPNKGWHVYNTEHLFRYLLCYMVYKMGCNKLIIGLWS